MKTTTYTCDACGTQIAAAKVTDLTMAGPTTGNPIKRDLCVPCGRWLLDEFFNTQRTPPWRETATDER